ncbi:hypothetical protein AB0K16_22045 [Nonomuraea jabiensis]|uniref:hypothetical protein n=1 Tax=Nonomuraea jabiensis TaxID=882448 RepID=UPI003414FD71
MSHSPLIPPGHGYRPPQKRSKTGWLIAAIVGGIVFLLMASCTVWTVVEAASRAKSGRTPLDLPPASATAQAVEESSPAEPTPEETTKEPEPAKPRTVLVASGQGIKNTEQFTVDGTWELRYSFDCSGSYIGTGYMGVYLYEGRSLRGVAVNQTGKSGKDTTPQFDSGTLRMEVNSTCKWSLKVVDIP